VLVVCVTTPRLQELKAALAQELKMSRTVGTASLLGMVESQGFLASSPIDAVFRFVPTGNMAADGDGEGSSGDDGPAVNGDDSLAVCAPRTQEDENDPEVIVFTDDGAGITEGNPDTAGDAIDSEVSPISLVIGLFDGEFIVEAAATAIELYVDAMSTAIDSVPPPSPVDGGVPGGVPMDPESPTKYPNPDGGDDRNTGRPPVPSSTGRPPVLGPLVQGGRMAAARSIGASATMTRVQAGGSPVGTTIRSGVQTPMIRGTRDFRQWTSPQPSAVPTRGR
jgi:hypothetical protein